MVPSTPPRPALAPRMAAWRGSLLRRALLSLALVAGLGLAPAVLSGCGEEAVMTRPEDPRKRKPSAKKASAELAGQVIIPLQNERWKAIQPHYKRYLSQKHTSPKDVFKSSVLKFIPRPVLEEKAESDEPEPRLDIVDELETGPLQQYSLSDYTLMLIMSGTAVPKAVVVDPRGQAYVVQRDTRIGNKGGIIDSITQYMVVVKEPNAEEPVKMTIKPPYVDLAGQAGFAPGDFEMSESDFDAPPAVNPSRGAKL